MNIEFYREFPGPIHPQFVVQRLSEQRFSASRQTLMHVAMAYYRTNPHSKDNVGLKFMDSLIKNKFNMYLTDREGVTPLGYLLGSDIYPKWVSPIIKLAEKY